MDNEQDDIIIIDGDVDEIVEAEKKESKPKKKMKRWKRIVLTIIEVIFGLIALLCIVFIILRVTGKSSLYNKVEWLKPFLGEEEHLDEIDINPDDMGDVDNSGDTMSSAKTSIEFVEGEDYDAIYNGKKYVYNSDIITLLILGIDREGKVEPAADAISGGQADALFLLVINPDKDTMEIIAIPRDTIARVTVYNPDGTFSTEGYTQICLQHGFGDGMELSNERTKEAVSKLFYNLPIHSVTSINMGAVPDLNDSVGGVTLPSLHTFQNGNYSFVEGQQVTLMGNKAYAYIRYRDCNEHFTAAQRLTRQKQYMTYFINQAIGMVKENIGTVVDVYDVIKDYVVTDLSINEMTYLASEAIGYTFNGIYALEGEISTKMKYERFYVNNEKFDQLIIDRFYNEAE